MKRTVATAFAAVVIALPAQAAEVSYRNEIRPLIKAQCAECHGDGAPTLAEFLLDQEKYKKDKSGPRTDTYADLLQLIGWPDSGAFMRRLDDGSNSADKKPGNMYKYLGETDPERAANLKILKAWVGDEGSWNLNRWAKRGDVPAITKEQLDKLKLKY
ncbi:MAG: cytochrome C [Burkholderiaceae bacterium]|nr:cytochrome C [Burkholderiaceae bacterium]